MKRGSFLKSLLAIAISPKIVMSVAKNMAVKESVMQLSSNALFTDLNLLIPEYYKSFTEKYGNEYYTIFLNETNDFV